MAAESVIRWFTTLSIFFSFHFQHSCIDPRFMVPRAHVADLFLMLCGRGFELSLRMQTHFLLSLVYAEKEQQP